jgi:hypothetical protein
MKKLYPMYLNLFIGVKNKDFSMTKDVDWA